MASSQPSTPKKSSRLLSRLLPWRSNSSATLQNTALVAKAEDRDTTVRRTSPVDTNLGVAPLNLNASGTQTTSLLPRRNGCLKNGVRQPESEENDASRRQELATLRDLAAELHHALRRSEEENTLLKARLQTLDDLGLCLPAEEPPQSLGDIISDLRRLASTPPTSSSNLCRMVALLKQRQAELQRTRNQLFEAQTELVFAEAELEEARRALRKLQQRMIFTEDELATAKQKLAQATVSRQRLMQELQTTRGLLMRCWARVRLLEQEQDGEPRAPVKP